jgi:hypothetical protein
MAHVGREDGYDTQARNHRARPGTSVLPCDAQGRASALLASSGTPHAVLPPWIDLFVDLVATTHGLAAALQSDRAASGPCTPTFSTAWCRCALSYSRRRGRRRRDPRGNDAFGLLNAVGNLCAGVDGDPRYDARRMVGLLLAALHQPESAFG